MKFVAVRELRLRPGEVWKKLGREHELVITSRSRPIGVLTAVDDDVEQTLRAIRLARTELAVAHLQHGSVQRQLDRMGMEDIDAVIRQTRKERRERERRR